MANFPPQFHNKNISVHNSCHDNDLNVLLEIEHAAKQAPWSEAILRDCLHGNYCCWRLEIATEIVGFIVFSLVAGEIDLLNICIKPNKQRLGYGTMLLTELLQYAKQQQASTIFLEVRESNKSAIELYTKLGFSELGQRKNYYPKDNGRENAAIMALTLT